MTNPLILQYRYEEKTIPDNIILINEHILATCLQGLLNNKLELNSPDNWNLVISKIPSKNMINRKHDSSHEVHNINQFLLNNLHCQENITYRDLQKLNSTTDNIEIDLATTNQASFITISSNIKERENKFYVEVSTKSYVFNQKTTTPSNKTITTASIHTQIHSFFSVTSTADAIFECQNTEVLNALRNYEGYIDIFSSENKFESLLESR